MKTRLRIVVVLGMALAGCGDEATEDRTGQVRTSQEPQEVNLLVEAPQDDTIVRGRSVVVRGTVAPEDATVEIDGERIDVRSGGRFAERVRLPDLGPNSISLTASADGFEPAEENLSLERERTARELSQVRERRRQRREQELAPLRSSAITIPYNQLEKNPERHAGTKVKYTGQIFQIQEEGDSTIILLAVTHEPTIDFWDDNVWVNYEGTINSAEDDVITIYGEVLGTRSYETQIGGETFVPEIDAEIVEE